MIVLVADTHVHVQRLVSVVKMATVLEECTTKEQPSVVLFFFLWAKGLRAKDIHKGMFPVYGGKCLAPIDFHLFGPLKNHLGGRRFTHDEEAGMEVWKWLRQLSKDVYTVSFNAPVKRWDKFMNVGRGYVEN
jgi:hypothetical protein